MSYELLEAARAETGSITAWRRYLHANPELSNDERLTADYLAGQLREMGLQPRCNIGDTFGLVADIPAGAGPAVALRADMDALPIQEETGLPFASTRPGVMHACGHDAHMAMLLGAARLLMQRRTRLRRPVRLIFQPAEEHAPGGAAAMISAGVLDGVESIFGIHVWSRLPAGELGTRVGAFMSSVDDIRLTIRGKGGHAAMPQECIDPVLVAGHVIIAVQSIVSRSIAMTDSAVVSITRVNAGSASNIIPETACLEGTIRTLDEPVRARTVARLRELVDGAAKAHGAAAELQIEPGYPALINDEATVGRVLEAARRLGWSAAAIRTLPAQGGGEDFAYYAQKAPAAFVFLGACPTDPGTAYPHHHPRFDIDEDILPQGAALLAQYALDA